MKVKGFISYLILFAFLGWCVVSFRTDIAQIRFGPVLAARNWIALAAGLSLFNYLLRVTRWWSYMKRLGHALPFGFCMLTYIAGFAFTLSPGKVGEMVRGRYYQHIGVPLSSTAAAFFIERFMDLLAMLALACLALATSSKYRNLVWGAGIGIFIILLILAIAPWARITSWVQTLHWLSAKPKRLLQGIFRTLISARSLLHPKLLFVGFFLALLAWGSEGLGLMAIGHMFSTPSMDWATATSIYSIAIIVGALSFLPGGLGGTEAVMIALLSAHQYRLADAILLTVICRLLTLWLAVVIGWIAVFFLRRNKVLEGNTR